MAATFDCRTAARSSSGRREPARRTNGRRSDAERRMQMGTRHLVALAAAVVAVTTVTAAGQAVQTPGSSPRGSAAAGSPQPAARKAYVVPRTADGQPDFQGVWANNTITPLQRPPQWAGKQF